MGGVHHGHRFHIMAIVAQTPVDSRLREKDGSVVREPPASPFTECKEVRGMLMRYFFKGYGSVFAGG